MPTPATAPSTTLERRNDTIPMQPKSTPATCPILTSCAEVSRVNPGLPQGIDWALLTPEALSSLRLPDWLKQDGLRICCLKMFPEFYSMTRGRRLRPSSPRFMAWGMVSNGVCLTAPTTGRLNQGEGCILSDILIPDAPEKYFLSPEQTERLLYKFLEGRRDQGSTTLQEPPAPRLPEQEAWEEKQGCT